MLDFLEILASIVTFKASLGMDIFRCILETCVQSFEAPEDVGNFLPKKEILSWNWSLNIWMIELYELWQFVYYKQKTEFK